MLDQFQTSFVSQLGSNVLLEFLSDESIAGAGFEAGYTCGEVDACVSPVIIRCGQHGACRGGACVCQDGYSGESCEQPPDACQQIDCHTGQCSNGVCTCGSDGYTGSRCEVPPDTCLFDVDAQRASTVDCGRHGGCRNVPRGDPLYRACTCTDGFSGAHCEEPPDLCLYPEPHDVRPPTPTLPPRPND